MREVRQKNTPAHTKNKLKYKILWMPFLINLYRMDSVMACCQYISILINAHKSLLDNSKSVSKLELCLIYTLKFSVGNVAKGKF